MKAQNAGTVRSRTRKLFQLGTRPNDPFSDIAYVAIFRLEMTKLHSVFGGKSLHPKIWTKLDKNVMSHSVHILSIPIDAKIQQHIIVLLYKPCKRQFHVKNGDIFSNFAKVWYIRCTGRIQHCISGNCAATLRTCVRWKIKVSRFDLRET